MRKAGEYLKSVREEKGYSILEVSKSTKLSASVLRALEEGRIDNIDPIYLKGFLKIYCRFLGLAWEDFLKEHPLPSSAKHQQKQPEKPRQEKKIKNKKLILIFVSAVAASLFLVLAVRGCVFMAKKLSAISAARKTAPVKPKTPPKTVTRKTIPAPQAPALPKRQSTLVVSPPDMPKESAEKSQTPEPAAKDVKPREVTLVVRAQEDCHLTVRVDGKLLYQRQLPKNKTESWIAKDKIELSVGNAGGITLEANGKLISTLGKRGQTIKNILITREGLKIQ